MYKRVVVFLVLMFLGGLLLPALTVAAAGSQPDDGVVIWNQDYTLAAGQTLDGNLVVLNGDVTLASGSRVRGNAVVWNGSIDADGVIDGNLVAADSDIRLGRTGRVRGDVLCTWDCDFSREVGSRVDGEVVHWRPGRVMPWGEWAVPGSRILTPIPQERLPWRSAAQHLLQWIVRTVQRLVTILVVTAIGGIVALIWPTATARVTDAAFASPGPSLGVGFLTLLAGIALVIVLAITICLSPAAVLLALALGAVALYGWVAIGAGVGRHLLDALKVGDVTPLWTASLGTLIITLITMGLRVALCLAPLGWLLTLVVGSLGLGAAVLTRLGTRPYVAGQAARRAEPTPAPPEGAPASPPSQEGALEPPARDAADGPPESR